MTSALAIAQVARMRVGDLMGQAGLPPSVLYGETEIELSVYRGRTVALLRRYAKASVEVGRLPSLLGREFFRTRVSSSTRKSFEDVVIFVTDMEKAIEKLGVMEKQLLAMNILEEYTVDEIARLLAYNPRKIRRLLAEALDQLAGILVEGGILGCQEGRNHKCQLSCSKRGQYKSGKNVQTPPRI
jgi:hypothetical protein